MVLPTTFINYVFLASPIPHDVGDKTIQFAKDQTISKIVVSYSHISYHVSGNLAHRWSDFKSAIILNAQVIFTCSPPTVFPYYFGVIGYFLYVRRSQRKGYSVVW
jgi:hypothetical protein